MKKGRKEGKDRRFEGNVQIEQTSHWGHNLSNLYISTWMQHGDRINRKVQRKVLGGLPKLILYIVQDTLYFFPCYMYLYM